MTGLLSVASIAVMVAFVAVLCLFLHSLRRILARTAERLGAVLTTAQQVRLHCGSIGPAVEAMNLNLYEVATNLAEVGDLSEELSNQSRP